ncbi:MAG: Hsp20/alpha crystallin family protein [Nitrospiraceae bacterium]|nr:MAG: Hsp20/alpha crystallin family protein [Nitrospiraceae bacterium]
MTAQKIIKHEKQGIEPYRPSGWFAPFERMEEMFDEFLRRPLGHSIWPSLPRMLEEMGPVPMVDIYEEGDHVIVKSDLPGLSKEDLDINLTEDTITLSGEKKKEEKVEKKDYYRLERSFGSFKRSFRLPTEVNTSKAKATFRDGVLEVKIPKTETAKRKEHKVKIE